VARSMHPHNPADPCSGQSQRDCVLQSKVARHELTWINSRIENNPNGVAAPAQDWRASAYLGERNEMKTTPTVLWPTLCAGVGNGWAATALQLGMFGKR